MDVDPRRLRVLHAVAVRGGVGEAAALLHLTPSAVSQQLALLEREVGVPLLDRSRRRIGLTAAGRVLAGHAAAVEEQLAAARRDLAALTGRASGPVRVAAMGTVVRHLLLPVMARLAEEQPEVVPTVRELWGPPALHELRTGAVDLAVGERDGGEPEPSLRGLVVETLYDDEYRVVVPALWAAPPTSTADLAAVAWVAGPPGSATGDALARVAAEAGFTPRMVHVCDDYAMAQDLVGAGHGAAVLPLLALTAPREDVRVAALPPVGVRHLQLLTRRTRGAQEPVVAALVDALRATAADLTRARTPA